MIMWQNLSASYSILVANLHSPQKQLKTVRRISDECK